MLKLTGNKSTPLDTDDFYIEEKSNGLDELIFYISIYDENYPYVVEEAEIEYEQRYLIKAIDGGSSQAKVKCQINLDELKATLNISYTNGSATLANTINGVLPEGWTLDDQSGITISRTIEGAYTPYDVIMQCPDTYGCVLRFDVVQKIVHAYDPTNFRPKGAFASRDLNLKEINYKGKSTDFYTRLYAYGKNGLSFASINNGKPYVDCNTYTDKIICAYWQDDRYEIPENLMADAQAMVNTAGVPSQSYECTVLDLAQTNPEEYSFEDFSLFSVVRLIDDIKEVSTLYQVSQYRRYPYYPEKNIVTLSSTAPMIQNQVQQIRQSLSENGQIYTMIQQAQNAANDIISGTNGGHVVFHANQNGQIYEILVLDTTSESTATDVIRIDASGISHSNSGITGTFTVLIPLTTGLINLSNTYGNITGERITGTIDGIDGINIQTSTALLQAGASGIELLSIQDGSKTAVTISGYGEIVVGTFPGTLTDPGTITPQTSISGGEVQCVHLTQTSDKEKKENIRDIPEELAQNIIYRSRPAAFSYKGESRTTLGFIAQDVRKLVGDGYSLVSDSDTFGMSLSYTDMIAPIVKVLQMQHEEIRKLKEVVKCPE